MYRDNWDDDANSDYGRGDDEDDDDDDEIMELLVSDVLGESDKLLAQQNHGIGRGNLTGREKTS